MLVIFAVKWFCENLNKFNSKIASFLHNIYTHTDQRKKYSFTYSQREMI